MGVLFHTKGLTKERYDRVVQRLASLAMSVFKTSDTKQVNAVLAKVKKLEGDQVVFASQKGKPEAVSHAKHVELGLCADIVGEAQIGIKLEKHDGEAVALNLKPVEAVTVAAWLVNRLWDLHEFNNLDGPEKKELAAISDTLGRYFCLMDGTTDKIREEQRQLHHKAFEAKYYSSLSGLEKSAEVRVRGEYEQAIKTLSQAALMPAGAERSILLDQVAPIVKKVYGHE